jgi:hypothetical protein
MKCGYIQFSGGHGEFMPLFLEIVHFEFGMAIGYCYRSFESRPNYDGKRN